MTSVWIMVSFLLHIISLAAIYHLFKQYRLLKNANSDEMEALFMTYLEEFKEENRQLQQQLAHMEDRETKQDHPVSTAVVMEAQADGFTLPESTGANDFVEASTEAKILQYHSQGWTEDEIAKALNCGKTEVALTIKMHAKKRNKT